MALSQLVRTYDAPIVCCCFDTPRFSFASLRNLQDIHFSGPSTQHNTTLSEHHSNNVNDELHATCACLQGRPDPTDALTINPGADVQDIRKNHGGPAGPTPTSVRYDADAAGSEMSMGLAPTPAGQQSDVSMGADSGYAEVG